jgi:hypothetical protein
MNVKNTEEATIKQAGVVHGSSRICDYLPLVAFWRVVGRFERKILESRVENQITSDI